MTAFIPTLLSIQLSINPQRQSHLHGPKAVQKLLSSLTHRWAHKEPSQIADMLLWCHPAGFFESMQNIGEHSRRLIPWLFHIKLYPRRPNRLNNASWSKDLWNLKSQSRRHTGCKILFFLFRLANLNVNGPPESPIQESALNMSPRLPLNLPGCKLTVLLRRSCAPAHKWLFEVLAPSAFLLKQASSGFNRSVVVCSREG